MKLRFQCFCAAAFILGPIAADDFLIAQQGFAKKRLSCRHLCHHIIKASLQGFGLCLLQASVGCGTFCRRQFAADSLRFFQLQLNMFPQLIP